MPVRGLQYQATATTAAIDVKRTVGLAVEVDAGGCARVCGDGWAYVCFCAGVLHRWAQEGRGMLRAFHQLGGVARCFSVFRAGAVRPSNEALYPKNNEATRNQHVQQERETLAATSHKQITSAVHRKTGITHSRAPWLGLRHAAATRDIVMQHDVLLRACACQAGAKLGDGPSSLRKNTLRGHAGCRDR